MLEKILFNIASYFIKMYAKDAIVLGAETLVKKTNTSIDDKLLDVFLNQAVRSKGNNLNEYKKTKIMQDLSSTRD